MKINSFNSATPASVTNNSNDNFDKKNNVTFTGNNAAKVKEGFQSFLSLDRPGTMNLKLFVTNAFVFLLGTRLVTSRDKDEKREIKVRDIPSIVIAVYGVTWVQKAAAKAFNKSGIPIMEHVTDKAGAITKKIRKLIGRPETKDNLVGEVPFSRLKDWYVYDTKNPMGIEKFSNRLADLGGDLKKIYSPLNKEIEKDFADCKTNEAVMNKVKSSKDIANRLINALKDEKNKAFYNAKSRKSITALAGFAVTLSLLGFFIPKLNIAVTERINKKRALEAKAKEQPQEAQKAA